MFLQLSTGSAVIAISILIMTTAMAITIASLTRIGDWVVSGRQFLKVTTVLTVVTLWLLAAISATVWLWAGVLLALGLFEDLETSVYFSVVSLTTLGYGDLTLPKEWRLLSGFIAADGLVVFGLNTAFLFETIARIRTVWSEQKSGEPA